MIIRNNYDKYGFALKSVSRKFYEQWYEPHIEIKYITNVKYKNINSHGIPFKDTIYSIKTFNDKELIKGLYQAIKDLDIVEATKYFLETYPTETKSIVYSIPSCVLKNKDFFTYLCNYVTNLPEKEQNEIKKLINEKLKGIQKFLNNLEPSLVL